MELYTTVFVLTEDKSHVYISQKCNFNDNNWNGTRAHSSAKAQQLHNIQSSCINLHTLTDISPLNMPDFKF